jgi:hypothetical protein
MNDTIVLIAVMLWMASQVAIIGIICPIIVKELRMIRGILALDSAKPPEERKIGRNSARSVLSPYKDDRRIGK